MQIPVRIVRILLKAAKLLGLLILIRAFGPLGALQCVSGIVSVRQRLYSRFTRSRFHST